MTQEDPGRDAVRERSGLSSLRKGRKREEKLKQAHADSLREVESAENFRSNGEVGRTHHSHNRDQSS